MIALAFGGGLRGRRSCMRADRLHGSGVAGRRSWPASRAAFMSGSRGALLALPFILLLLAPVVWRRSRRSFLTVSVFLAVFAAVLLAGNVGRMATRIVTAYAQLSRADHRRRENGRPLGRRPHQAAVACHTGCSGRTAARRRRQRVERGGRANSPARRTKTERIALPYNQAHNQYADDLAKGGIVRFLLGFLDAVPAALLFLKCEPFSGRKGSEFALARRRHSRRAS